MPPSRDTEALLDRVRKLLALAESPNVHEAAAAASRAQALIEAHRLQSVLDAEEREQADPVTDGSEAPLESTKRLRKWKIVLAQGLAQANGCVAYTAKVGKREQALRVAGREADRLAVHALWDWLVKQIEWLSATEGAGRDRAWHDGFRIGAAEVVGDRLASVAAAQKQALRATVDPAALVKLEPALAVRQQQVDRYVEQELNLRPGRSLRVVASAYLEGQRAGGQVPLRPESE